ncbi:hypothetical protein Poly30_08670 [Planctomycetes bacterium Poly30]|uniref:FG-GAP repeat protein n=1 Tax=Saltatorellus ferox TaxID=2528018 RepID=A0A518EMR0_9BACT|nr:hypothetical protein Poly30_08670 [Planctomycetes bacterium Poly30]
MQLSIFLGATLLGSGAILMFGRSASEFASPVQLTSGDAALAAKVRYPSPRLLDVDGDGTREMVVGDLPGFVRVAKPAGGDDLLAWGELAPLKTDGRELKFNNW